MKVCVVGSGGREHALACALARTASVVVAPGNPGMTALSDDVICTAQSPEAVAADLYVIGPEAPLVDGLADRQAAQAVFARVERQPRFCGRFDRQHRLAGPNGLADLGRDDAYDAIGGCSEHRLCLPPLDDGKRGGSELDLRVRYGERFLGGTRFGRGVVGLRRGDVGACRRRIRFGVTGSAGSGAFLLVTRLLRVNVSFLQS